jgi:GntR family transcriptional regulator
MGDIDRFSPVPAYRQIADVLRGQISAGAVSPGEKLPSERELCERYDVDRGVVRRALALLQAWGLVVTEHGRGAFVRVQPPLRRVARNRAEATRGRRWRGFYADVEDAGLAPTARGIPAPHSRTPTLFNLVTEAQVADAVSGYNASRSRGGGAA